MASQKKGKRKTGARNTRTASTAKKGTTGRTTTRSGNRSGSASRDPKSFELQNEVILMTALVVSILLLLSNFGLGGKVGNSVNGFMFGLFGLINYLFPILLFLGTAFYLANRGNRALPSKMLYLLGMFLMVTAFFQLITHYSEAQLGDLSLKTFLSPADYFSLSKLYKKGGGLFGGFVTLIFDPLFGKIGSFVVIIALLLVFFMLFSKKAIFAWIARITSERYADHKVHAEERREYYEQRQAERSRIIEEKRREMSERRAQTFLLSEEEKQSLQGYPGAPAEVTEPSNPKQQTAVREPKERKKKQGSLAATILNKKPDVREVEPSISGVYEPTAQGKSNTEDSFTSSELVARDALSGLTPSGSVDISATHKNTQISESSKDSTAVVSASQIDEMIYGNEYSLPKETVNEVNKFYGEEKKKAATATGLAMTEISPSTGEYKRRGPTVAEELMALGMEKDRQTSGGKTMWEVSPNTAKKQEEPVNYDAVEPTDSPDAEAMREKMAASRASTAGRNSGVRASSNSSADASTQTKSQNVEQKNVAASQNGESETITVEEAKPIKKYEFPSVELLTKPKQSKAISEADLRETAAKLQTTLDSFGVRVTVSNVSCGPAVTRYELLPEQGVKVSRITSLADDIKLNLAAADVRIEAPIPGKAAVGIEVPNKENSTVYLRELLESNEFEKHSSRVAFAVGKDIGGQTVVTDIAKMPHLLIAGATGSGKSVCINTLIMSILYKADPKDVKLIMVDPKVVELSVYNGIPHLLIPVVTDPKKASAALNWAVMEMTDRYQKFADLGVRDLKGYNERVDRAAEQGLEEEKYKRLPQIVIIVDELADLMMVAPGEVEESICRLAQLARAAGLHLVIATQRPSVNVITGLIKANIPSRIAFAVSSAIDSRTILDGAGAEKLLGKGDMLFFPSGYSKPVRVQGAFVSDNEVSAVVDFLKEQCDGSNINNDVADKIASIPQASDSATDSGTSDGYDEYFAEAGRLIIEKDKASIGMLQRAYKIGFNRAARIMDQLAEVGVVGPEEGTKPRKVLMSLEQFDNYLGG